MTPSRPWTFDTLIRFAVGVGHCVLAGMIISGALHYDASAARLSRGVFYLVNLGALGTLAGAAALLLREWKKEQFMQRWVGTLAFMFVALNLAAVASQFGGAKRAGPPGLTEVVIATLSLQGASLPLFVWLVRSNGMNWNEAFGLWHRRCRSIGQGLALGLVALPVLWALQLACAHVLQRSGWQAKPQTMVEVFLKTAELPGQLYLTFAAVILAPISEELFFRGVLYPALKRQFSRSLALAAVALLFAAAHAHAATFLPLGLFGLGLTLLYERTDNLLAPIAAHATFNAGNVVMLIAAERLHWFPQ